MRLALSLTLLLLCAVGANSHADVLELKPSSPKTEPAAGDSLMVGVGVAYVPEYAGSDKSRLMPLPFLERTFDNGFFLSTTRGAGYQATVDGVNLSAALTYGGGREDHKRNFGSGSDALKGMGDIDGSAQAVLGASYQAGSVGLSVSTAQNLGKRQHGATYTLGASMPLYRSNSDQIGLGASAVYGDNKHMQTYFGVTTAQSAAAGYRAYTAKGGFENVNAAVSWDHVIDKNWSTHSVVGFSRLLSDAADSPLTKRKTTPMLMTGVSYKF